MSETINIILLVLCGFAALFMIKRVFFGAQSSKQRVATKDPAAQEVYENYKSKDDDEEKSLTLQEKIELSWEFLTKIANQVIERFSRSDKEVIYKSGEIFNKHGMQYQHNVNQEVVIGKQTALSKTKTQSKDKEQSISR